MTSQEKPKGTEVPRHRIYNAREGKRPNLESENEKITWVRPDFQQDTKALSQDNCGDINQHYQCDVETAVLTKEAEISRCDYAIEI